MTDNIDPFLAKRKTVKELDGMAAEAQQRAAEAYRRDRLLDHINTAETTARKYGYEQTAAYLRVAYNTVIQEGTP